MRQDLIFKSGIKQNVGSVGALGSESTLGNAGTKWAGASCFFGMKK